MFLAQLCPRLLQLHTQVAQLLGQRALGARLLVGATSRLLHLAGQLLLGLGKGGLGRLGLLDLRRQRGPLARQAAPLRAEAAQFALGIVQLGGELGQLLLKVLGRLFDGVLVTHCNGSQFFCSI